MNRLVTIALLFFISLVANAYEIPDGQIDIPEGFVGPEMHRMGQGIQSIAFKMPHEDNTGTLLQISIWNPGQKFPVLSENELKEGAKKYLLQFLGGIQRKRQNYIQSEVEYISISGIPAAKATWTGEAHGRKMHGTMYCYINESKIVSLHTQDFVEYDGKYTSMAIKSFESIRLSK